jgi:N-acetyl sugar amidotransferase
MTDKIGASLDRQRANQPKNVFYCKRCVVSNQRPRITFDERGICSACQFADRKQRDIDWMSRNAQLRSLCDQYRRTDGRYDVLVPCSGGKDSSAVAHKLKHWYGMNPLTVTWAPFIYTDIGWENYQAFIHSGFTNFLAWPNGHLHRKLARIAIEAVGDNFLPFIFGQMAYAFHIAAQFDIKLVFYGENGEAEYGGTSRHNDRPYMPLEDWADLYWKGVTIEDLIQWGKERDLIRDIDYTKADLYFYKPPAREVLEERGIQMHWFSYYHKWVPQENYYYAAEHTGLQANRDGRSEGTYSKYASLDDKMDGFHYYLAYLKFGIGRATSDSAHEVRDGHITREEAVALVRRYDGEFPGKYLAECLEYMELTEQKLHEILDIYRPDHLWERTPDGWRLKHAVWYE